ncbi:MAG: ABC transporter ATP-binding protein [Trueperaceae bacterium]|nr:MAG: ABC transporter ATP-binding protein [Trueperaceae bacterium]
MILTIEDLKVHYRSRRGAVQAVDGADLSVPKGQIMGLVGESGCGKTTLARAIMGVLPRNGLLAGGKIHFDGRELRARDESALRALRWRDISFIPQSAMNSLDPVYRVGDQLKEVLVQRGGYARERATERSVELFGLVGLDPARLRDYPHQFSGGMRQRAAIALALALDPKLIIADEPVTALDVIVQRQILDTLKELQRQLRLSVLLVTHDISVVAYVCDQVAVMYAGRVVESGPAQVVLTRPFHPYTMGLYNAFPDLERATGELTPIEGSPPDLRTPPEGCRFEARCPFAVSDCGKAPALEEIEQGHQVACWRAGEAVQLREQAAEVSTWQRS